LPGPFQRLVLIGPLDDILANGLDPLAGQRGGERDHAVCGKGTVMDDRHPAVLIVERRAAPQVRQYARSDRSVIVALAAIAPEIVAARGDLFIRAPEGRR